jgi:hypothetical protein
MIGKIDVEIGGETRRIAFGQNAWYLFTKMQGITPDKIRPFMADQLMNPAAFRDIIYCGLKAVDLTEGKKIEYNEYLVGDWLDAMKPEALDLIISTVLESLGVSAGEKVVKKKGK